MNEKYKVNLNNISGMFPIPVSIVDKYIKIASLEQLKVILLIFKDSCKEYDAKYLADQLGYSVSVISDALNFWKFEGVLCDGTDISEYTDTTKITKNEPKITSPKTFMRMSGKEMAEKLDSDPSAKILLTEAEDIFGMVLSPTNKSVLLGIYDYCGMDIDVILMLLVYVKSKGIVNMRYIEKVAYSMVDEGVFDHQSAIRFFETLEENSNREAQIIKEFGIKSTMLSSKQKEYVKRWYADYKFDMEMIRIAFDKCVDATGKLSFPYIDKILSNWYQSGIAIPKQVFEEDRKIYQLKKSAKTQTKKSNRSYDVNDFTLQNYTVPKINKK